MGLGSSARNNFLSSKSSIVVRGRKYRILDTIGQGGEATVYRCQDKSGFQHAVKVFYFSQFSPAQVRHRIDGFNKEARILTYLRGRSPHFIHLVDYEYRPKENIGYMIMELGHGSLRQYMQGMPLNEPLRQTYWQQIVNILTALQDARVVHADIKPENLILVNGILKITDLSLAFRLNSPNAAVRQPMIRGTIDYMAPEVFSHKTSFKSDVWSAGVILYEMTYGRPPYFGLFDRHEKMEVIARMTPINFPPLNDLYLLDIMQQCLILDARFRPSAYHLLNHPYTSIYILFILDFESILLDKMSQTSAFSRFENANQFRPDGKSTTSDRFNLETLFNFSTLQPRVQTHLKNVYTCLLITTVCAALGVYLPMIGWLNYPRLAVFASIITSIWLFTIDLNARTQIKCFGLMSVTALFIGIYLSPLINLAINVDPQIVITAFLLTTTIFICFTLSALLTRKRTYLYLGGLLGTGTSVMIILSLMNVFGFGQSQLIFNINLYLDLFIACGYILYDTQLIVQRAVQGDMNYVNTKKVRIDNNNSKKNRSSTASHPSLVDETEKQMEMKLIESSPPSPEIRQPEKQMPFRKKSSAKTSGEGDSSMFDLTLDQLKELMELRGKELLEKLNSSTYNGVKGILEKLKVDGNQGLDSSSQEDLEQRRAAYGRNEIPPKPMKSFFRLCWDALHDMLLIILLVCAVVSIGLSFYKPPHEADHVNEDERT
ncbi:unnamed protein product [Rotaria sp. Silwood2]|nr:unnamed protein product [Rotaria sp. Silwood2]